MPVVRRYRREGRDQRSDFTLRMPSFECAKDEESVDVTRRRMRRAVGTVKNHRESFTERKAVSWSNNELAKYAGAMEAKKEQDSKAQAAEELQTANDESSAVHEKETQLDATASPPVKKNGSKVNGNENHYNSTDRFLQAGLAVMTLYALKKEHFAAAGCYAGLLCGAVSIHGIHQPTWPLKLNHSSDMKMDLTDEAALFLGAGWAASADSHALGLAHFGGSAEDKGSLAWSIATARPVSVRFLSPWSGGNLAEGSAWRQSQRAALVGVNLEALPVCA